MGADGGATGARPRVRRRREFRGCGRAAAALPRLRSRGPRSRTPATTTVFVVGGGDSGWHGKWWVEEGREEDGRAAPEGLPLARHAGGRRAQGNRGVHRRWRRKSRWSR